MKKYIKNLLNQRLDEIERLKGGKADGKSVEDIAKKHDVGLSALKIELAKGIKHELEHTKNRNTAKEIALDHLFEDPKYYTKLKRAKIDESEVNIVGSVPSTITYNVKFDGREAGKLIIGKADPKLGDDTAEIMDVQMNEGYTDLNSTIKAVRHIWQILPEVNRLVVTVTPENQIIWEKIGFQRLNNSYWMATRGH